MQECTFQPKINPSPIELQDSVVKRNDQWLKHKKARLTRAIKSQEKLTAPKFHPEIGTSTNSYLKTRASNPYK